MKKADYATKGILSAASGVTALVSTRIYPIYAKPGATRPYLVYNTSAMPVEGDKVSKTTFRAIVQVNCYGVTQSSSTELADEVRLAMQVQRNVTINTVVVQSVAMMNQISNPDPQAFEEGTYCEILEFIMYIS